MSRTDGILENLKTFIQEFTPLCFDASSARKARLTWFFSVIGSQISDTAWREVHRGKTLAAWYDTACQIIAIPTNWHETTLSMSDPQGADSMSARLFCESSTARISFAGIFHPWVRWEGPGFGFESSCGVSGGGVWKSGNIKLEQPGFQTAWDIAGQKCQGLALNRLCQT